MKQLYIIRHGETENNKEHIIQGRSLDTSINDIGRLQAEAIAQALEEEEVGKIICSGLKRTHETAEPLSALKNLPMEKYAELEEINFGELEGQKFDEIQDKVMEVHDQWQSGNVDFAPKNGESPRSAYIRANGKVQEILESSDEECIVFMVHGRLIRILLSEWLGLGLENMHKIEHQNGAINHLTWENGKFSAVKLNMTEHLHKLV